MNSGKIRNKKAQTWSIDLVVGVVIFLLVIFIVYSLIASRQVKENQLRDDADRIYSRLDSRSDKIDGVPKVLDGNSIPADKLLELYKENYSDLKKKLGVTNDFCILVVTDSNGIVNTTAGNSIGTGEDILISNNLYCGN